MRITHTHRWQNKTSHHLSVAVGTVRVATRVEELGLQKRHAAALALEAVLVPLGLERRDKVVRQRLLARLAHEACAEMRQMYTPENAPPPPLFTEILHGMWCAQQLAALRQVEDAGDEVLAAHTAAHEQTKTSPDGSDEHLQSKQREWMY